MKLLSTTQRSCCCFKKNLISCQFYLSSALAHENAHSCQSNALFEIVLGQSMPHGV